MSKKIFFIIYSICMVLLFSCTSTVSLKDQTGADSLEFQELYGYLLKGHEKKLKDTAPYTHIFYFSAPVNYTGRITRSVSRPDIVLKNGHRPKVDLVITELSNASLMHFVLDPRFESRDLLLDDIERVSRRFDGVQLDFESVRPGDRNNFHQFVRLLKKRIGSRTLSLAIPARTRTLKRDAYAYRELSAIADKLVIMAYDEHWSTSAAGPVASLEWCNRVSAYASANIPQNKLVMGLPFYGRAWQKKRHNRAYGFSGIERLRDNKDLTSNGYNDKEGPFFSYEERVEVDVYYDNERSIYNKLLTYHNRGVEAVAFWRIGLGPDNIWGLISTD